MPVSDTAANEIHIMLKTKSRDEFFIKKGLSLVKNRPEKALLSVCMCNLPDNSLCSDNRLGSMKNTPLPENLGIRRGKFSELPALSYTFLSKTYTDFILRGANPLIGSEKCYIYLSNNRNNGFT